MQRAAHRGRQKPTSAHSGEKGSVLFRAFQLEVSSKGTK